jgi:hydroxypyruvate reductase
MPASSREISLRKSNGSGLYLFTLDPEGEPTRNWMADLKQAALRIFRETFAAIDIPATMRRKLARAGSLIRVNGGLLDMAPFERICAISIGKASLALARGLSEVLSPDFRAEGIVVAPSHFGPSLWGNLPQGFRAIAAGHPVPDAGSFAAGRAILELLATTSERTLVFFLLSGGGSALVEQPLDPAVELEDMQGLNRWLVTCGASIDEINAVRKHLSAVKGGRLAVAASAARKITFGVTDVPEGQESALASGPTLPDPTTVSDACGVVGRYGLLAKLPARIRMQFEHPETISETPKAGNPAFRGSAFQILLGRHDLFHPAHHAAEAAGFVTVCDNTADDWPIESAADFLLDELAALKRENPSCPVAVIAGGELSSPVRGDGVGGRNSAFVLHCVKRIAGQRIAVLSVGTDGIDGSSPAAGAVADGETSARAHSLGLDPGDYFRRSDSYTFFRKLDDAIETGPTGNNLRDLRVLLAE